jgi:hypothetical protein
VHHEFAEEAATGERNVDFGPAGSGRLAVALAGLGVLAILVWYTMEPGKFQSLTWVLLGFFAFRVTLGWLRSR